MLYPFTDFGSSSSSGIGALGLDGQALLIQLVTFVLAFLVLKRFAFKPIMKVLDARRATIESGVKLGEQMQKERAAAAAMVAEQLRAARTQADAVLAAAEEAAQETTRQAEAKAREKAEAILTEATERTLQDMARARKRLEGELVGLVSDATEAIIGEKVDARKDAALLDKALKVRQEAV